MPIDPYSSSGARSDSAAAGGADAGAGSRDRPEEADPWREPPDAERVGEASGGVSTLLERQLHDHPLPTLLAAVAAGWIVGKILR